MSTHPGNYLPPLLPSWFLDCFNQRNHAKHRGNQQTQQQLQHRHHTLKIKIRPNKWQQQKSNATAACHKLFRESAAESNDQLQGNSSVGNGFSFGGGAASTPFASSPAATSTNSSVGNGFSFGGGAASSPIRTSSPAATSTNSSVGNASRLVVEQQQPHSHHLQQPAAPTVA